MDKASAQRIVFETFKAVFDRKRFRDFINELCNGFDESKAIPMLVPDAFKPHIKSCQRLGTFESADGELADVLIVHLTESYKLNRTRTALRDFVAHKLKRGDSYKEAGFVAFVAPDLQWRFSYVRMEYETRRDPDTGKIKSEERLTPARRYSYLVGADEECHTAQTRFLPILQNTSDKPSLAQIEDAFSVESVTNEFFKEYVRLFETTEAALAALVKDDETLRADFEAKHVNTADFTKKLLGQIVFLYFIQKKGWLGVAKGGKWGDGPRHFLRQLAAQAIEKKQCLFNDVLEPLFYDKLQSSYSYSTVSRFDLSCPFVELALETLMGKHAVASFVLPEHLWLGEYFVSFREHTYKHWREVTSLKEGYFESVNNPASMLIMTSEVCDDLVIGKSLPEKVVVRRKQSKEFLENEVQLGSRGQEIHTFKVFFDMDYLTLKTRFSKNSNCFFLDKVCIVTDGVQTANLTVSNLTGQ